MHNTVLRTARARLVQRGALVALGRRRALGLARAAALARSVDQGEARRAGGARPHVGEARVAVVVGALLAYAGPGLSVASRARGARRSAVRAHVAVRVGARRAVGATHTGASAARGCRSALGLVVVTARHALVVVVQVEAVAAALAAHGLIVVARVAIGVVARHCSIIGCVDVDTRTSIQRVQRRVLTDLRRWWAERVYITPCRCAMHVEVAAYSPHAAPTRPKPESHAAQTVPSATVHDAQSVGAPAPHVAACGAVRINLR